MTRPSSVGCAAISSTAPFRRDCLCRNSVIRAASARAFDPGRGLDAADADIGELARGEKVSDRRAGRVFGQRLPRPDRDQAGNLVRVDRSVRGIGDRRDRLAEECILLGRGKTRREEGDEHESDLETPNTIRGQLSRHGGGPPWPPTLRRGWHFVVAGGDKPRPYGD